MVSSANACIEPLPPILPDPQVAVIAEMVKAQKEMKRYVAEQEGFLQCVESAEEHNQAIDRMKAMAARFNHIIREYKTRVKS